MGELESEADLQSMDAGDSELDPGRETEDELESMVGPEPASRAASEEEAPDQDKVRLPPASSTETLVAIEEPEEPEEPAA